MTSSSSITLEQARDNLALHLRQWDLERYVSASVVEEWLYKTDPCDNAKLVNILLGLLHFSADFDEASTDLLQSMSDLSNVLPHECLGGKIPAELSLSREKGGLPKEIILLENQNPLIQTSGFCGFFSVIFFTSPP
ncbi:MAG: hypothetical protein G01um101418_845 [Parcubacteria group bacterium Gr01-1014_18]|nr:MAG: hypothetical protein Greene041636_805 [Parcubacteria group bacterium Greene0416_36]TSC79846.1 MAG: hypothetical protein G01um101418_845 [Parcubacteria group bacterium Gr01-1014_18]TSC98278.1 MAG: hypothetical protein Greene101420_782 [Parcubacteria group bacterium Greene1014_20]TSD06682.1 MAG: hypothetical protein Greene07142_734 [Parcubacteria group bacterium Greene0714_2]